MNVLRRYFSGAGHPAPDFQKEGIRDRQANLAGRLLAASVELDKGCRFERFGWIVQVTRPEPSTKDEAHA